ncbi:MAG TPA: sulfite exporter TauE/SafE family protein [Pirellulales bacterium]|nr:sulfite exporter TauE/SafE family protein [Pirellulales bacterium]
MEVTPVNALLLLAAGGVTGVLGAILGTGGGVFLIPLLVMVLGVPMHEAVATSIVSVIATSSAVASTNVERGIANMRLGMTLEIATALGAIAGGLTAAVLAPRSLEVLFALVLVPTALLMWRGRTEKSADSAADDATKPATSSSSNSPSPLGGSYFDPAVGRVSYNVERLPAGLAVAFVAGNLSGLLGIGGGVFKVPALHLLCGVPVKAAAATSNFMIGVTAVASAFLYYGNGMVMPGVTAAAVLGVLAGSALGSVLNRSIGGRAVSRLFAVLLLLVAAQMLARALQGK